MNARVCVLVLACVRAVSRELPSHPSTRTLIFPPPKRGTGGVEGEGEEGGGKEGGGRRQHCSNRVLNPKLQSEAPFPLRHYRSLPQARLRPVRGWSRRVFTLKQVQSPSLERGREHTYTHTHTKGVGMGVGVGVVDCGHLSAVTFYLCKSPSIPGQTQDPLHSRHLH